MFLKALCFSVEEGVGVCSFEPLLPLKKILFLIFFFLHIHVLILTLGNPSCHGGS